MREHYTFLTPENVELRYEVAGIGSRLMAAMLDYFVLALVYTAFTLGMAGGAPLLGRWLYEWLDRATAQAVVPWLMGALILLWFLSWWGYFVIFELLWNGQSPGKRVIGLRVLRGNGQPVGLIASLVRNFLRSVDLFLFIGVLVMFLDRSSRRLGDFAAGTMVVREPRRLRAQAFSAVNIPEVAASSVDALPNAARVTSSHYALVRDYFARRGRMRPEEVRRLSIALSGEIRRTLEIERTGVDPEEFLATVARAYEERQRYREGSDGGRAGVVS